MITITTFLVLTIICIVLGIYALLDVGYKYSDAAASMAATCLGWVLTILLASGQVGDTVLTVATETIAGNATIYAYAAENLRMIDPALAGVFMLGSLGISAFTLLSVYGIITDLTGFGGDDE